MVNTILEAPRLRLGYPAIDDPEHPLWEAQQAGWPDHAPHEAMSEAVRSMRAGAGDSADHPSYARDAIRNPLATRPADDEAEAEPEQDRR